MNLKSGIQKVTVFMKKYSQGVTAVVFSLALISVAYSFVYNPSIARADCSWETVLTNLNGDCPEGYDDVGGGWCGAFVNCNSGGGDTGGGSGPTTCPADYDVDIGCPQPNYSGSNIQHHTYTLQSTCNPNSPIVDDGSGPTCSSYTNTCVDEVSPPTYTCVGFNWCSPQPPATPYPAPGNDINNCGTNVNPDCSARYWYDCSASQHSGSPAEGQKWNIAYEITWPLIFQDSTLECAWALPPDVQESDNPDCSKPYGPSCDTSCFPPDTGDGGPAASSISVTVPNGVTWTIAPDGYTGTGTGSPSAPITVNPTDGDNSYTLTPGGSCIGPTVTSTVDGVAGGSTVVLPTNDVGGHVVTFSVTCAGAFTYTISKPANVSIQIGSSGNNTSQVQTVSGTPQQVSFTPSGAPAGVSVVYTSCTPGAAPGTCTSGGTITVGSGVPIGNYTITITSAPAPAQTQSFTLTVQPGPLAPSGGSPDTTGTPNPASTGQQVTWKSCTATAGLPPYTYTWTGTDVNNVTTPTNTLLYTYTTPGTKIMNVKITDTNGGRVDCNQGSEKVVLNAKFQEF